MSRLFRVLMLTMLTGAVAAADQSAMRMYVVHLPIHSYRLLAMAMDRNGDIWFGWNVAGEMVSETRRFDGDRAAVRAATVRHALVRLLEMLPRK